jgi:hypothetical protein
MFHPRIDRLQNEKFSLVAKQKAETASHEGCPRVIWHSSEADIQTTNKSLVIHPHLFYQVLSGYTISEIRAEKTGLQFRTFEMHCSFHFRQRNPLSDIDLRNIKENKDSNCVILG